MRRQPSRYKWFYWSGRQRDRLSPLVDAELAALINQVVNAFFIVTRVHPAGVDVRDQNHTEVGGRVATSSAVMYTAGSRLGALASSGTVYTCSSVTVQQSEQLQIQSCLDP